MSKVTITIDDTNPALVAAFGEGTLETVADQMGYMEMVEKNEAELPEKSELVFTNPVTGEEVKSLGYPEGTEMYKPNPQSKAEFVAYKILTENIAPRLMQDLASRKRSEAAIAAEQEIKQAEGLITSIAEVKVE